MNLDVLVFRCVLQHPSVQPGDAMNEISALFEVSAFSRQPGSKLQCK